MEKTHTSKEDYMVCKLCFNSIFFFIKSLFLEGEVAFYFYFAFLSTGLLKLPPITQMGRILYMDIFIFHTLYFCTAGNSNPRTDASIQ